VAVEEQTPFADLVALFREAQHSRLPIYRETLDDPIGMLHIKDVFALIESGPADNCAGRPHHHQAEREVLFVRPPCRRSISC